MARSGETGAGLPAFYDDLDATLDAALACLAAGARDRTDPFHTPALASVGLDGGPRARTVVLRGWDAGERVLRIHTDRRAAKAAELAANPAVALHVYDPARKLQLRLAGAASQHADDAGAAAAWAATQPMSRLCYQVVDPPGAPVADPRAVAFDAAATGDGADHFMVLRIAVARIEWLYLAHEGHRRAAFEWDAAAARWAGRWLVP